MDMFIRLAEISRLHQEENYEFHKLMIQEFAKCKDSKFLPVLENYRISIERFGEVRKKLGTSAFTLEMEQCDNRCDTAYHGFVARVHNMIHFPDVTKREAARKIEFVINRYVDPTTQSYIEQSGILARLLEEISMPHLQEAIVIIGAKDWIEELKNSHEELIKLFANRARTQACAVTRAIRNARLESDQAFRKCIKRLNALAELEGLENYTDFIDTVKKLIDHQRAILINRKIDSPIAG